jgi:hypothetical protein
MTTILDQKKILKTRTNHRCCACDGIIEKGSACFKQVYVDCGDFVCIYYHVGQCEDVTDYD